MGNGLLWLTVTSTGLPFGVSPAMDTNVWAQVGGAVFQVRVNDLAHRDADGKVVGLRGEFVNPTFAVSRLSAFIPLSELECLEKPDEPEKFLGKVLRCRVINI